jgi:platelet-activating factor acetylhydrolase
LGVDIPNVFATSPPAAMPIFSTIFPTLPKYPGPYDVGTVDVEIPLPPEKTKNFPVTETSVETVLVRFFYPADLSKVPRNKRHASPSWLPQPSLEYAKGYANFLKQPIMPVSLAISLAVYNTHISAVENAPPLDPPVSRFPVMIFSHGLGGSRNAYSQWCGSVASYGVFVAAIEHRDGSAPASVVRAGTEKQASVPYRRITEYNDETKPLRTSQLTQRTYEVAQLVSLLRDVNHGKEVGLDVKIASILDQFKGLLNTKKGQMIMAGHSFGAATTVAACKDKENVESDYPLKDEFKAALCLDIWMMVYT